MFAVRFLLGFRKFTILIILIVVASVFRATGLIDGAEFVDLLKGVSIAFMGCNLGEYVILPIREWIAQKTKINIDTNKKKKKTNG